MKSALPIGCGDARAACTTSHHREDHAELCHNPTSVRMPRRSRVHRRNASPPLPNFAGSLPQRIPTPAELRRIAAATPDLPVRTCPAAAATRGGIARTCQPAAAARSRSLPDLSGERCRAFAVSSGHVSEPLQRLTKPSELVRSPLQRTHIGSRLGRDGCVAHLRSRCTCQMGATTFADWGRACRISETTRCDVAQTCLAGLVRRLKERRRKICERIPSSGPLSVRIARRALRRGDRGARRTSRRHPEVLRSDPSGAPGRVGSRRSAG